ncbi:MAG TPA: hypothetical protein GXX28_07790 [Firmicutes bacterium]|nr:hypothetical protein [Bacillota bacterium]
MTAEERRRLIKAVDVCFSILDRATTPYLVREDTPIWLRVEIGQANRVLGRLSARLHHPERREINAGAEAC